MRRLSFLEDEPWDDVEDDKRVRWFGHPFGADVLGASLRELLPGSPGGPLHMHYGVEEMFFVLAGTPTVRTREGEEQLSPGDVVYFPEGPDGLHDFSNPTAEAAVSAGNHVFAADNLRKAHYAIRDEARMLDHIRRMAHDARNENLAVR